MRKLLPGLFSFIAVFLLNSSFLHSQVVMNEYSAANKDDFADNFSEYEDWIELYNGGASAVNIGGFYLSDNTSNLAKYLIPTVSIPASGHVIFFCSNKNTVVGTSYHTNFKLTQTKYETIYLSDASLTVLDSVVLDPCQKNHSRGRRTDGSANWGVFPVTTPGFANANGYIDYTPKPVFSLAPGFYVGGALFNVSCAQAGATLRYTTDGTEPTAASPILGGSLSLSQTTIYKVKSFSSNPQYCPSFTETNTYFFNDPHPKMAVISLGGDLNDLFSNGSWEVISSFEYFDSLGVFRHEGDGDFRGHGNDSWAFPQKGIRFYARDEYGYANNIKRQLFEATPRDEFDVVILKAGASDNYPFANTQNGLRSCHIRDAFAQTLSQSHGLDLDVRSYAPCALYINGQYWGLYEIRERVDADFTDFYYDQPKDSVDMLAYWGGLTIEEGSDTAWNSLYTFMTTNNLAIQSNYDYVTDRMDVLSLIDYFILNTFVVDTDWLNWNTSWWRGTAGAGVKWRYRLWDEDNIFNLGQNYTGVGTTTYLNDPCNPTQLFPGDPDIPHGDMLNALDANPDFHSLYINRYADLLNTTFDCDIMIPHLDKMVNRINGEMAKQIARWGGSVPQWNEFLDSIRAQINGRCQVVDSLMVDCYNLTGPFDITVLVDPPGAGGVKVNTIIPVSYPFVGSYYGGVTVKFSEATNGPWDLSYWTVNNHTPLPNALGDSISFVLTQGDTIVAHYDTTVANDPSSLWNNRMKVYPVPSEGMLYIQYEIAQSAPFSIALYALTGNKVADIAVNKNSSPGVYQEEVDLQKLGIPAGIYFVNFASENYKNTQKIIFVSQ